jgi:hypothetical protein
MNPEQSVTILYIIAKGSGGTGCTLAMAAALSASEASTVVAGMCERGTGLGVLCSTASTGLKLQLVSKFLAGSDEDGHRGVAAEGSGWRICG